MSKGSPPLPEFAHKETKELRDRLPVVEVSNEVIWVNPEIQAPFDMKEGESTKLGVFISNENQERSIGTAQGHGRTGIFGKVIFEDVQGRHYRDVDAKGIGHVRYNSISGHSEASEFYDRTEGPYSSSNPGMLGLMDRSVALKDASMAEELLSHGVRTYRVIGITKLNELIAQSQDIFEGGRREEKISVTNAKQRQMINEAIDPVVEVRAFGTRARIQDKNEDGVLSDAIELVRQELNLSPEQFQVKEFIHWYAETLGTNVGRLHKQKLTHGYLSEHNLTLDCRIVDLDSIKTEQEMPDLKHIPLHPADSKEILMVPKAQMPYVHDFLTAYATLTSLDYSHVVDAVYEDAYRRALQEKDPPPLPKSV